MGKKKTEGSLSGAKWKFLKHRKKVISPPALATGLDQEGNIKLKNRGLLYRIPTWTSLEEIT